VSTWTNVPVDVTTVRSTPIASTLPDRLSVLAKTVLSEMELNVKVRNCTERLNSLIKRSLIDRAKCISLKDG
jgi:hypothetical protein